MNKHVMLVTAVLLIAFGGCRPKQEEGAELDQNQPGLAPEEPTANEGVKPGDGMEGERAKPSDTMAPKHEPREGTEGKTGAGPAGTPLAVEEIAEKPDMHIGERITVQGEVEDVLGDHALTVQGDGKQLVVLGRRNAAWTAHPDIADRHVVATGTLLRMSNAADIEQNLGWDLDAKTEDELKDAKVVLIATNLAPVESGAQKKHSK